MGSPAFIHILRVSYAPGDPDLRVCWGVYSQCVKLWRQVVSKSLHRKDIGDFRHVLGVRSPITRDEIRRQSPYVY